LTFRNVWGIEKLINLQVLDLCGNPIEDYAPISSLNIFCCVCYED